MVMCQMGFDVVKIKICKGCNIPATNDGNDGMMKEECDEFSSYEDEEFI
jgi:hypothetical protein